MLIISPVVAAPLAKTGEWQGYLTRYGAPKYKVGFNHFDYVNADAPKRGEIKLAESGTFDSLNPFILKGVAAPGITMIFESLMVSSLDEPQSMYPLVAESVRVAPDNSAAEFRIHSAARFQDGTPITPEDVVFSFETLKAKGDPSYRILYAPIAEVKKTGEHLVRFTFSDTSNQELAQIAAGLPILSKTYYATHDFEKSTLEPPLASGPYKVASVDAGRGIIYERVRDYWAAGLPVNRGMYNFDRIRYDLYRDENVTLEAFKAGAYDFRQEYIARNWATAYQSPALEQGRFIKHAFKDSKPQGMQGFIYNTRKAKFADSRVREAIALTLDFDWLNQTIFYGAYTRNTSYFKNTEFASQGLPSADELALLQPFADSMPVELFSQAFTLPQTDGSGNARSNLLKAQALLNAAGFPVKGGKRIDPSTGRQMEIEFMLQQPTMERVIGPMRSNLERLGIAATIRMVDSAQYQKRVEGYDFDIVSVWLNRGVFYPGNEQKSFWHSAQADIRGGNNLGGIKNPAVDALVERILNARDEATLTTAARALDRVLLWEHYVIPHWHSSTFRLAYWDKFGLPKVQPKYNNGFITWWVR